MRFSEHSSMGSRLLLAAFIVWMAALAAVFIYFHPFNLGIFGQVWAMSRNAMPDPPPVLSAWGGHLLHLAALLGMLAAAGSLGDRILRFLGADPELGERGVFAMCLGLGPLSLLVFALGLLGLLVPGPLMVLVALLIVPALFRWRSLLRRPVPPKQRRDWFHGSLLVLFFLITGVVGVAALAPDMGWDPMVYHLRCPADYVQLHRIHSQPQIPHSYFPFNMEMLYTLGMALTGEGAAKLVNFSMLLLIAWAMIRFLGSLPGTGGATGWLSVLLLVSTPFYAMLATQCYVDAGMALFAFMAVWCLAKAFPAGERDPAGGSRDRVWVPVCAVLTGMMLGMKYSALLYAGLLGLLLLWFGVRRNGWKAGISVTAGYGALSAGLALPWAVKNWVTTGNPVYPMAAAWFPETGFNPYFTLAEAEKIIPYAKSLGLGGRLAEFLTFSWDLFVRSNDLGTPVSVLFLALLPAVVFTWKKIPGSLRLFLGFGLLSFLCSALTAQGMRYILPAFAAAAPGLAWAAMRTLEDHRGWGSAAIRTLLVALIAVNGAYFASVNSRNYNNWAVSLGLETREAYLERMTIPTRDYYRMAQYVSRTLPPRAKFLMIGDIVTYCYERGSVFEYQYIMPSVFVRLMRGADTAEAMARRLRRLGITHAVYNMRKAYSMQASSGAWAWEERQFPLVRDLWLKHFRPAAATGSVYLYEMNPPGVMTLPGSPCPHLPGLEELWMVRADQGGVNGDLPGQTMALYQEFRKFAPMVGAGRGRMGALLMSQKLFKEAHREFQAAFDAGVKEAEVLQGLALCVATVDKDYARAVELQAGAVTQDPMNFSMRRNLGVLLLQAGNRSEAVRQLHVALQLDPANDEVRKLLDSIR